MASVSDRIKGARERAGLTQEQLASALGVDQQQVSRWERGTKPSAKALKLLEGATGAKLARVGKKLQGETVTPAGVDEAARYVQSLCFFRKQKKLTAQQLSEASGVTESVISGIENGKLGCVDPWVKPLAKALGCQVSDIYNGEAGPKETIGELPASVWAGKTTVEALKAPSLLCGWCKREHEGLGCRECDVQ